MSKVERLLELCDTYYRTDTLAPEELVQLAREVAEAVKEYGAAEAATCQHEHSLFYYCDDTDGRQRRASVALRALCRDED